ncbi:RNA polymerase sigma factor [Streptomyces sp. NPDC002659]|uniref:RNA polymerase sigma factor n=1 Tax=Streptomyces sp. NPDC002659 TaxID=3364656 RepID=UPI0036C3E9F3
MVKRNRRSRSLGPKPATWDEFQRSRFGPLCGWAQRLTYGSGFDHEGAMNDAFVELWRQWSDIENPMAWVMVVVHRKWVDHLRRPKPEVPCGLSSDVDSLSPDRAFARTEGRPGTEEQALLNMRASEALRALSMLEEQDREILLLAAVGYVDREIGDFLGIRPGTARQRLRRARIELKRVAVPDLRSAPTAEEVS